MKRSLEKNLEAMTPTERDEAIDQLQKSHGKSQNIPGHFCGRVMEKLNGAQESQLNSAQTLLSSAAITMNHTDTVTTARV